MIVLYRGVLGRPLANLEDVTRAKMPVRLPVVLSKREVAVLQRLPVAASMRAHPFGIGSSPWACVRA